MQILVTGCAGFIGFHTCIKLCEEKNGNKIIGIDNLNNYYDPILKKNRLKILKKKNNFKFYKVNIENKKTLDEIVQLNKIDIIVNLAAQAGVRYSIDNPEAYLKTNILGFFNILEISRKLKVKHLIFASSSSVYGNSSNFPLKENSNTDKPLSFYAASKKSNEVMAYSYSNIYKIPMTCLRFFTVYGPYGRPDMSLFKFVKNISNNKKIDVYNFGNHERDFTYIEDVTEIISKLNNKVPKGKVPFKIFNISSNNPKTLNYFISLIEKNLLKKAKKNFFKLQIGDVKKTHGNSRLINQYINKKPFTKLENGIKRFVEWYKSYYK